MHYADFMTESVNCIQVYWRSTAQGDGTEDIGRKTAFEFAEPGFQADYTDHRVAVHISSEQATQENGQPQGRIQCVMTGLNDGLAEAVGTVTCVADASDGSGTIRCLVQESKHLALLADFPLEQLEPKQIFEFVSLLLSGVEAIAKRVASAIAVNESLRARSLPALEVAALARNVHAVLARIKVAHVHHPIPPEEIRL